jgi:hypothetical protein
MNSKLELAFTLIVVTANWFLECLRENKDERKIENDNAGDAKEEHKSDEPDSDRAE